MDKNLIAKVSKIESLIEEIKIEIFYIKNSLEKIMGYITSNNIKSELIQRDVIMHTSINEVKLLLNEILNILYYKKGE
ncbi:MAG: hypothetical protein NZ926_00945 [Candidatus Methanomethylicia archaeon]|nr:hypothetical protein [Candidatus Methanomethylicia archaeon]MCX8168999.1 hypothetical protein [Candidatus Methanomethylicia archaeon]MDW7988730.1 hypothetical protein [Nitrososphaerota archaeon]